MSKRTIDTFFKSPNKKLKVDASKSDDSDLHLLLDNKHSPEAKIEPQNKPNADISIEFTSHAAYAWPIRELAAELKDSLTSILGTAGGKSITNQPHLDLLYFQPLISQPTSTDLFHYLRSNLPFYRVNYKISRFGKTIDINTPRYTTVYGLDETAQFKTIRSTSTLAKDDIINHTTTTIIDSKTLLPVPAKKYSDCQVPPRPIPPALELLKNMTEAITNETYNFVLVNYYASGSDSISYHSDDERFLGDNPCIASFTLGAKRDFLMKHKSIGHGSGNGSKTNKKGAGIVEDDGKPYPGTTPIKLPLGSGDMIVMKGETQRNWLHSIPKRAQGKGGGEQGRINITMRKAMVPGGTENYYRYNVGVGPVYRWDEEVREMKEWKKV